MHSPFTNFLVPTIDPDAKCRVGIALDPNKRRVTYKDDWPHAGKFSVITPTPSTRAGAAEHAVKFSQGCGCKYDYQPDERTSEGAWYVYHFLQGGRGIRAIPDRMGRR